MALMRCATMVEASSDGFFRGKGLAMMEPSCAVPIQRHGWPRWKRTVSGTWCDTHALHKWNVIVVHVSGSVVEVAVATSDGCAYIDKTFVFDLLCGSPQSVEHPLP